MMIVNKQQSHGSRVAFPMDRSWSMALFWGDHGIPVGNIEKATWKMAQSK